MKPSWIKIFVVLLNLVVWTRPSCGQTLPSLKVSDNQRFLQTADGQPFFWLGDTAWELFHRLDREQAILYLDNRAANGFNVVQAVALAELDGLNDPNAYGHRPLIDSDPTRPDVKDGPQNDYWDHVDFVIREANKRGIYIGLLPTWGDKWNKKWGVGPEIFNARNAQAYAQWLVARYKNAGIVWILGGDRPIESDLHREINQAFAKGIHAVNSGKQLITFHPSGGNGSSQYFHNDSWLDFNMRQNGHVAEFTGRYETTHADYLLEPKKPVIDGEPIYEDHPISFDAARFGHSSAADVRRPFYWNVFSGAFGHTYGHHSVWQMWTQDEPPINNPLMPWQVAINQAGARQMQYGRRLMESRPFFDRIPDSSIIVEDRVATSVPGAGRYRFVATRDAAGTYLMVYVPLGRKFSVDTACIHGKQLRGWWYDPRNGQSESIGEMENRGQREFTPPALGEQLDWILVLDDASKNYAAPGSTK